MGLIADVFDVVPAPELTRLDGCFLERPLVGTQADPGAVSVSGWALGATSPVVAVEVGHGDDVVARSASLSQRPDVASAYPRHPDANRCGFQMSVGGIWGEPIELCVRAVLSDQSRCAIGSLRVRTSAAGDATPLVSVVIPCYGHAHFLPEAITSVLSQTHANVEVVVVDDGSQDNVVAVVAQYPGVRLVRQENRGLAAARNTGIRESNGEFLVFLDADDMLTSTAVEAGLDCFDRHPDCQLVMGRFRSVDWDRQLQWWSPRELPASVDHYASLLSGDYAGPPAICMYRRFALETLGGFDEAVPAAADYDLSLRVARNYPIEFHDSEVLDYRKGSYNMSNDGRLMFDNVMRVARRHRRHARAREDLRVAYTTGVEYWRELYASRALEQIEAAIVDHDLRGSLAGAMSLVRHDPPRLPAVVARVRRYNRLRRAKTQTTK